MRSHTVTVNARSAYRARCTVCNAHIIIIIILNYNNHLLVRQRCSVSADMGICIGVRKLIDEMERRNVSYPTSSPRVAYDQLTGRVPLSSRRHIGSDVRDVVSETIRDRLLARRVYISCTPRTSTGVCPRRRIERDKRSCTGRGVRRKCAGSKTRSETPSTFLCHQSISPRRSVQRTCIRAHGTQNT